MTTRAKHESEISHQGINTSATNPSPVGAAFSMARSINEGTAKLSFEGNKRPPLRNLTADPSRTRVHYFAQKIMTKELLRTDLQIAGVRKRSILAIGFFSLVLFASRRNVLARLPLSPSPELSFLRGAEGHESAFTRLSLATKPLLDQKKPGSPVLFDLSVVNLEEINDIGIRIQSETIKQWTGIRDNIVREWDRLTKQWSGIRDNIAREWDKLTSSIAKFFSREQLQGTRKLDEVLRTFRSVLNGNEVDMAQLLQACRAHLILMKSGGAAMRVVAKDMEGNLHKAESFFSTLAPEEGRHLASLLEAERASGVHDGSMLKDDSAAMGLLWIRRSLAFQLDLYASLIPKDGKHPSYAAMDAYSKTLSPYHGWMLQKVFSLSLSQMPDREVFIAKFGGMEVDELDQESENEVVKKLKMLVAMWEPIIDTWRSEFARLDLEDTRIV